MSSKSLLPKTDMLWCADQYGLLNFNTAQNTDMLDAMTLESICDFQEFFDHTSRMVNPYSDEVLFVCTCGPYRKNANCQHSTILSILTGPRFTLPAFLDERKIPKHARKDAKSRTYAERERIKEKDRRKKLVYTLMTSSEVCQGTLFFFVPLYH